MGTLALRDAGYLCDEIGFSNDYMYIKESWTGRNGINSREDFLLSRSAQFDALMRYTAINLKVLKQFGVVHNTSTTAQTFGHLAGAHLLGATQYARDSASVDANGVSGNKYYQTMQKVEWK